MDWTKCRNEDNECNERKKRKSHLYQLNEWKSVECVRLARSIKQIFLFEVEASFLYILILNNFLNFKF